MAIGNWRRFLLGTAGYITGQKHGLWDFIYQTSLTKDSNYNIGDVVETPDGRRFVYSKSTSAIVSGYGAKFADDGVNAIATITTAVAAGERTITFPAATHDTVTADSLRGGYCVLYNGTNDNVQFRGILGNTAAITGVAFTINLDGLLVDALTTSSKIEVFANPYGALVSDTDRVKPVAGLPAAPVAAANTYFWCQTAGFKWGTPSDPAIGLVGSNGLYWRHNGTLDGAVLALGATIGTYDSTQYAGYVVQGSQTGNGPLIKLQC
jgi:hypothetical protein